VYLSFSRLPHSTECRLQTNYVAQNAERDTVGRPSVCLSVRHIVILHLNEYTYHQTHSTIW